MRKPNKLLSVIVLTLSICILSTSFPVVNAASDKATDNQEQIEELISQICRNNLREYSNRINNIKSSNKLNFNSTSNIVTNNSDIENQLSKLGVKKLGKDDSSVSIQSTTASTSGLPSLSSFPSNVDVYTYTETGTISTKGYSLQLYFVTPKANSNSCLFQPYSAFNVYNTPSDFSSFGSKLLKIYSDKLTGTVIGLYPYVSWLPYELFGLDNTTYASGTQYDITVTLSSCMKYIYFKFNSSNYWTLNVSTQRVYGHEDHLFRYCGSYGVPQSVPESKEYDIKAPYFLPSGYSTIITQQNGAGTTYLDSVSQIKYYDETNTNTKTLVKSITPAFFPYIFELY